MFTFLFLLLALCAQQLLALDTVVDLGYAKYRGIYFGTNHDVIRWAGMRYAKSTSRIDGLRFTAPQDPVPERPGTVIDATDFGPTCIGTYTNLTDEFGGNQSEDCLYVNVFAPSNATNTTKLPVYVFIQGGGFNTNGNANYNGTKLIEAAGGDMVVVNFNYRVGPYGFLASKEITDDPSLSLNNGLKDQRQVLKWVQKYISNFGGDPGHVTLGGASAGAGSVVLQLIAYGGRNDSLFHAAAAESPAFPPLRNVSESEFQYNALLGQTGCKDLKCLQTLDAVTFQNAVRNLKTSFPSASGPPVYFWNPTLDYDFIRDYTYNEIKNQHFVKVPTIFGDDTNEGIIFTPSTVTSLVRADQFVSDQFTSLNTADQKKLQAIWQGPTDVGFDDKWRNVAADVYGHIRYICGGLNISAAYVTNGSVPTYQYRWNVGTATHVSELPSVWGNGSTAAGVFMQGYIVSFIRSYDPNKYKRTFYTGGGGNETALTSPDWVTFGQGGGQKRLLLNSGNDVHIENVSADETSKCETIANLGIQLQQAVTTGSSKSSGAKSAAPSNFAPTRPCLLYLGSILYTLYWIVT